MKVLVTGSSGVGKSSVTKELSERGYMAIDGDDEPGLVRLEIKETGEPAEWPKGFVDWSYYAWNLQLPVLEQVLARSETVILGGICGNQDRYYHLFDKVFVLTISPEEHLRRMRARPARSAGDDEQNIQDRLKKYPILMQRFLDAGAVPIDSSGTVKTTADSIVAYIKADEPGPLHKES